MKKAQLLFGLAVACTVASAAHAVTIVENFNYGSTPLTGSMNGLGGAVDGWGAAWADAQADSTKYTKYSAGPSLSFDSPLYANSANESNGAMTGQNIGVLASRAFANKIGSDVGIDGTIWASTLVSLSAGSSQAIIYLGSGNSVAMSLSLNSSGTDGSVNFKGDGTGSGNWRTATSIAVAKDKTYMMLARIQLNVNTNTANDLVDVWVFDTSDTTAGIPDLPSSIDALGAPIMSQAVVNIPGNSASNPWMGKIGVSLTKNATVDAIRISNDADGFSQVAAAVPETATLSLLALGSLALLRRR